VVLEGLNDKAADVGRLVRLLSRMRSKVNLIPFNPIGEGAFQRPRARALESMRRALVASGVPASVRWSKGVDISAACGQLWWREKSAAAGGRT
jgi:23S rRNA (adenine2503-C2)-methyltransferase